MRARVRCGWLSLMLLLPACIYRSQVKEEHARTPKRYARQASGATNADQPPDPGRWWKLFEDRRLDGLIGAALDGSPDLEIARARVEQAQAQLMGATSGWFPSIAVSGEAARRQSVFNPRILPGDIPISSGTTVDDNFQLSLTAAYEVDLWGRIRYGRDAAKHGFRAAQEMLRAAYLTLAASVADAYYLVVQQRALITLLNETIVNRERQIKLVEQRYDTGVARPADLYQARQNLAQAGAQRAQVGGVLRTAEHALAVLIGRYPGELDPGTLDRLPDAIRELEGGVPAHLMLQRPDLRAAHRRLLAADAQVGAAVAEYFPQVKLGASIGGRFDPTGMIYTLVAGLTAPIFQGGRIRAQHKEKKALLREGMASFKKTLLAAVKDVEDALVLGRAAEKQITWLEQRVTASEGALRLSVDQYVQGLSGYLDVLASEQALFNSRSDLIAVRRELIAARISLARALGGSWMDDEIERERKKDEAS